MQSAELPERAQALLRTSFCRRIRTAGSRKETRDRCGARPKRPMKARLLPRLLPATRSEAARSQRNLPRGRALLQGVARESPRRLYSRPPTRARAAQSRSHAAPEASTPRQEWQALLPEARGAKRHFPPKWFGPPTPLQNDLPRDQALQ